MMRIVLSAVVATGVAAFVTAPTTAQADEPGFQKQRRVHERVYQPRERVRTVVRHIRPRIVVRRPYVAPVYQEPVYQQPVYQPPVQYSTVYRQVEVAPARTFEQRIPARYDTVYETVVVPRTVMVEPERVVQYQVPAQYATVAQTVAVAPQPVYYQQPCYSRCNTGWNHWRWKWRSTCGYSNCW
jgi:hypothetical protein